MDIVKEDMRVVGVSEEDADDRVRWRQICCNRLQRKQPKVLLFSPRLIDLISKLFLNFFGQKKRGCLCFDPHMVNFILQVLYK